MEEATCEGCRTNHCTGKMSVDKPARMGFVNCNCLSPNINNTDKAVKKMSLVRGAKPTLKKGGGLRSSDSSAIDCASVIHW